MKKEDYLKQVEEALKNTDAATRDEILDDFNQHFAAGMRQGKSEDEIIASLGDVSQFDDLAGLPKVNPQEDKVENSQKKVTGKGQRGVIIDARHADVTVRPSADDTHHVRLIKDGNFVENSYQLERIETADELRIKIVSPKAFFRIDERDLALEIELSDACKTLRVETASGDVDLGELNLDEIRVRTASGDMEIETLRSTRVILNSASGDYSIDDLKGDLSIETASGDMEIDGHQGEALSITSVSGDLRYAGTARSVKITSVSGDGELELSNIENVKIDTVSGDFEIQLPRDISGVKLNFSAMSGELDFDLMDKKGRYEGHGGSTLIGDGKINLSLNSVSGDFSVEN